MMKSPKPTNDNAKYTANQQPAASEMEERRKVIEEYAQSLREYLKATRSFKLICSGHHRGPTPYHPMTFLTSSSVAAPL
jgi:hypothetical protein